MVDHPQDDLLIIEALINLSQHLEPDMPKRADRAWFLAQSIAAQHGLDLYDAVDQIEYQDLEETARAYH